jgi:hypothetical protein
MSDHITRLGERKGLCHFCDHAQHFEVAATLITRCAHSPIGVCVRHLSQGIKYVLSCVDAGDYVLVGIIGEPASGRPHVAH